MTLQKKKDMLQIHTLVFSPFQENTYLLYDETNECAIVDPGMLTPDEEQRLVQTIDQLGLTPVLALQTHLHLDHLFGSRFVFEKYGLLPWAHSADAFLLDGIQAYARQFGIDQMKNPPELAGFLNENDEVNFGNTTLKVIHVPGHSPGGVLFYNADASILVAGDVLFRGSVGRSDLPGGNQHELIDGIHAKLMVLPDEVQVYPGHGPATTIDYERAHNPFL